MKKILFLCPLMALSFLPNCSSKKYTITFDAGIGTYSKGQLLTTTVPANSKLLPIIKKCEIPTTNFGDVFAYYEYNDKEEAIDYSDTVTSNLTLKAHYSTFTTKLDNLDSFTWKTIKNIAVTGDASKWFNVGATKSVAVFNIVGPKVRIIDFYRDEDYEGTPLGITFEFTTLISDWDYHSLATQWNDTNDEMPNGNYLNSSIRKALTGEGNGHILWAQKEATEWTEDSLYKDKSILDRIEFESPDLFNVLSAPKKTVECYESGQWIAKDIMNDQGNYDKLFLLSPEEMGDAIMREGAYKYYKEQDEKALKAKRIKRQEGDDEEEYPKETRIPEGSGQTYQGYVHNYAGYNLKITEGVMGGHYWLRSPHTTHEGVVTGVAASGIVIKTLLFCDNYANGIAPAFCV